MAEQDLLEAPPEPIGLGELEASREWQEQKDPVKRMAALDYAAGAGQDYLRHGGGKSPTYGFASLQYERLYLDTAKRVRQSAVEDAISAFDDRELGEGAQMKTKVFPTRHPFVKNDDGSRSNVMLSSFNINGKERVIPTMVDGKKLSEKEAVDIAIKNGIDNYPSFATPEAANKWAESNHGGIDENGFISRINPAGGGSERDVLIQVMRDGGAGIEMLSEQGQSAYENLKAQLVNVEKAARDRVSRPLPTMAITTQGIVPMDQAKPGSHHLGGFEGRRTVGKDGKPVYDFEVGGMEGEGRLISFKPDIDAALATTQAELEQAEGELAERRENLDKLNIAQRVPGNAMFGAYPAISIGSAQSALESSKKRITELAGKVQILSGDKRNAEQYLALEHVTERLMEDSAYDGKFGVGWKSGWQTPAAMALQVAKAIPEGAVSSFQGALLLGSTMLPEDKQKAVRQYVEDLELVKQEAFGGIGLTEVNLRGNMVSKGAAAVLGEVPMLAASMGAGALPGWLVKGGFKLTSKATGKELLEQGTKAALKKFNNRVVAPAGGALFGGAREVQGTWTEQMDYIRERTDGFADLPDMTRTIEMLRQSPEPGAREQADELQKKYDEALRAEDNLGENMLATGAAISALEFLPMGKLFKHAGRSSEEIMDAFIMRNLKSVDKFRDKVGGAVDIAFAEGATEGLQKIASNAFAQGFYDDNQELFEGVGFEAAIGAIVGSAGGYAAGKYSQDINEAAFGRMWDAEKADEILMRSAAGVVEQNPETGKYFFNDRTDLTEEFDSKEEAAQFAEVRHRARTMVQVRDILKDRGHSDEEIMTTLQTMDFMAESSAVAIGQSAETNSSEGIYMAMPYKDAKDEGLGIEVEVIGEPGKEPETPVKGATTKELAAIAGAKESDIDRELGVQEIDITPESIPEAPRYRPLREIDISKVLPEEAQDKLENEVFNDRAEVMARLDELDSLIAEPNLPEEAKAVFRGEREFIETVLGREPKPEPEANVVQPVGGKPGLVTGPEPIKKRETKAQKKARERREKERGEIRQRVADRKRTVLEQETLTTQDQQRKAKAKARGQIELFAEQNKVLIKIFKDGDASTVLHEMIHGLQLLQTDEGVSIFDAVVGDNKGFWKWATNNGKVDKDSAEAREKMADGFELYLKEGVAPMPEFNDLFKRTSNMFRRIYLDIEDKMKLTKAAQSGFRKLFLSPDVAALNDPAVQAALERPSAEVLQQRAVEERGEVPKDGEPELANRPVRVSQRTGKPEGTTATDARTYIAGVGPRAANKEKQIEAKRSRLPNWQWLQKTVKYSKRAGGFMKRSLGSTDTLPTHMHLPSEAAAILAREAGVKDEVAFRLESILHDASKAMNEVYGSHVQIGRAGREARFQAEKKLNDYMMEDNPAMKRKILASLKGPIIPIAQKMRAQIDELSNQLIQAGVVKGKLAAIIQGRIGSYLHRSYEIFNNPHWEATVREDKQFLIDRFKAWAKRDLGITDEMELESLVNQYLDPVNFANGLVGFLQSGSLSKKNLKILKQRKDIPEEIRALWGERKDPFTNYANSVLKTSALLSAHKAQVKLRELGLAQGWFATKDTHLKRGLTRSISKQNNPALGALNGLWTNEDIYEGLGLAFDPAKTATLAGLGGALIKANQWAKYSHTVLSAGTHVRNFIGGGIMYFGNGHANPVHFWKGLQTAWEEVSRSKEGTARQQFFGEMIRRGVVDQNVTVSEFESVIDLLGNSKDALDFVDNWQGAMGRAAAQTGRTAVKKMMQLYRAGDTFWKVAAFQAELSALSKNKHLKMNAEEMMQEAADRVRATMPTYSLAPQWVKALNKAPTLGLFLTFTSESVRITLGQTKLAMRDLKTPGMRHHGIARIAGLVASRGGAMYGINLMTKAYNGLDDEKLDAMRNLLPFFLRNSDFTVLGKDEHGRHLVASVQFADPYSYFGQVANAARKAMNTPGSTRLDEGFFNLAKEILDPGLNPEFGLGALIDAAADRKRLWEPSDVPGSVRRMGAELLWKGMFQPSTVEQWNRLRESYEKKPNRAPFDVVMKSFFFGVTPMPVDMREAAAWRIVETKSDLDSSKARFAKALRTSKNPLQELDGIAKRQRELLEWAHLRTQDALKLGVDPFEMEDTLIGTGISKEMARAIMENEPMPVSIGYTRALKIAKDNPGALEKIDTDYSKLEIKKGSKAVSARSVEMDAAMER